MDTSRHQFSNFSLGVGQSRLPAFNEGLADHHWRRRLTRILTYDLPHLVKLLSSSRAQRQYGEILAIAARVILFGGLVVTAAFPPWKVTYTFAPYNKEALYTCTEYVGIGPIVGGKDSRNARTPGPSGDYRLYSKAPWASFPSRIHCDGYAGKHVGISFGRWLTHFVGILVGFSLCQAASVRMSRNQRSPG